MNLPKTYDEARREAIEAEGNRYPGRSLVRMELEPGYERSKNRLLPHIQTINEAHLIMLAEQEIVTPEDAAAIMGALRDLDYPSYKERSYTGKFEDLYLEMEDDLIQATGGAAGNLHLARSRNDMCVAWSHMVVRDELLHLIERLVALQNTVALFAAEHRETLYVVHTHTQHAQPGLLGHYFLGVVDLIGRGILRLQMAYKAANLSPMGAAAITTTGFPISRERVAELAGFDGVIDNAYDAIGNSDYFTQTASALSLCALDLGRVVTDMLTWATEEMKMIRVADGYISTSSIMPQKRNPIALEHLRSSLSVAKGLSDTVLTGFLKSPYGDISDYEDIEDTLSAAMDLLDQNIGLLHAVIATLEVDRALLKRRTYESFSVVTEIADELYRSCGMPFRKAHHFVSQLVKRAEAQQFDLRGITEEFFSEAYLEIVGEPFTGDFAPILRSIDPWNFVRSRNVRGGTGPQAMAAMLAASAEKTRAGALWCRACRDRLEAAREKRRLAGDRIVGKGEK